MVGIDNDMTDEELLRDIRARNGFKDPDCCKLLHAFVTKKTNRGRPGSKEPHPNSRTLILEVKPDTYSKIMTTERIFVGWQSCKV